MNFICLLKISWLYLPVRNCVNTLHFKIVSKNEGASWMSNHALFIKSPIKFYCWFSAKSHPLDYNCQELCCSIHRDRTLHVDDKILIAIPEEYSDTFLPKPLLHTEIIHIVYMYMYMDDIQFAAAKMLYTLQPDACQWLDNKI